MTEGVGSSVGGGIGRVDDTRERDRSSIGVMAKPGSRVERFGRDWCDPGGEFGRVRVSGSGVGCIENAVGAGGSRPGVGTGRRGEVRGAADDVWYVGRIPTEGGGIVRDTFGTGECKGVVERVGRSGGSAAVV